MIGLLNKIAVALVIIAAILAVTPQSYRSPGGYQGEKVGVVESKTVSCGIALAPKNPPPPPGTDDQCDAQHTRRGAMIVMALFGALALAVAGRLLGRRPRHLAGRSAS